MEVNPREATLDIKTESEAESEPISSEQDEHPQSSCSMCVHVTPKSTRPKRSIKPVMRLTYDKIGKTKDQPITIVHRGNIEAMNHSKVAHKQKSVGPSGLDAGMLKDSYRHSSHHHITGVLYTFQYCFRWYHFYPSFICLLFIFHCNFFYFKHFLINFDSPDGLLTLLLPILRTCAFLTPGL